MSINRSTFLFALFACLGACSQADGDLSIRFIVDDSSYELDHATFLSYRLPNTDSYFLGLGQDIRKIDIVTAVPGGDLQWRMPLDATSDLQGRELVFRGKSGLDLALQFTLTDSAAVHNGPESIVKIYFTRVDDNIVEGTFSASGLTYVSDDEISEGVSASGEFRAAHIQQ